VRKKSQGSSKDKQYDENWGQGQQELLDPAQWCSQLVLVHPSLPRARFYFRFPSFSAWMDFVDGLPILLLTPSNSESFIYVKGTLLVTPENELLNVIDMSHTSTPLAFQNRGKIKWKGITRATIKAIKQQPLKEHQCSIW
jgi:hypothetical protein